MSSKNPLPMYSDHYQVLLLVAHFRARGISRVVLCPGSRNTPLIHTFSACCDFECRAVTDERSAGFVALGWALQCSSPVAVCVTSGSALLNLHPAVSEAFYAQVPLVVVSADRPQAWIGQMDGQTVPQAGVFGTLVRKSVTLPEGDASTDRWYSNRLLNEVLLEVNHHGMGPVHINIPLSEPLFGFSQTELPEVCCIERWEEQELQRKLPERLSAFRRVMVVCGQLHENEARRLASLLPHREAACMVEHLSNLSGTEGCVQGFDTLLAVTDNTSWPSLYPDLVITVGGHIVSKRLKQFLRKAGAEHWHVSPDGRPVDVFQSLKIVVEIAPETFFSEWQKLALPSSAYAWEWRTRCEKLAGSPLGYSQCYAVQRVVQQLPADSVLHLANSSTVRLAEMASLPKGVTVCVNRGVNGIEGCLSSAVGYAMSSSRFNLLMIGDLSFFYDMNALCVTPLPSRLRVVLFNNGGGAIFHSLTPSMNEGLRRYVAAEHHLQAADWVRSRGWHYLSAHDAGQLEQALSQLMRTDTEQPVFLEVFTQAQIDAEAWKTYYESIKSKI